MSKNSNCGRIIGLVLAFSISVAPVLAKKKEAAAPAAPQGGFPAAVLDLVPGSERFEDAGYVKLVAGDAVTKADPAVLFERMVVATKNHENYKALYLARILTQRAPDSASAWENRGALAASLGFEKEAEASRANAGNPATRAEVTGEVLAGSGRLLAPATLADWAAAMALMGDDVSRKLGPSAVVSIQDNLFGTDVTAGEQGPETTDRALLVDGILPNTFAVQQAESMNTKHVKVGSLMAGIVSGLSGAAGQYIGDANLAARGSELYGKTMAGALEVDSTLEGGFFEARTYPGGREKLATRRPKPSGKFSAVEWPVPLLFASGPSTSTFVEAHWSKSGKTSDRKVAPRGGEAKAGSFKSMDLSFPRLAAFRDVNDRLLSAPVTPFEVMLSSEDLEALGGAEMSALRPDLGSAERAYTAPGQLVLDPNNAGKGVVGLAADGSAYAVEIAPRSWIIGRTSK